MTSIETAEKISATLHTYADAIRIGQVPAPDYITLHAANLPFDQFMTLADHHDVPVEIIEPEPHKGQHWLPYARITLPFPTITTGGLDFKSVTTSSMGKLTDQRREAIAAHNHRHATTGEPIEVTRGMGTGNVANDDEESLVFADESEWAE